ncbi:peptide-methionine (S)-S-oxide reductase MsrA [Aurantimonas sp. CSK15Z-1]|nr:peptide-methionine (S)-S-oxide reductase MsrA [Aurantimonas sp. CSK15Z-1]MCQ8783031.1 peptide-methionine (S)-S-oxide reductase MsrA [Aurantimonas sp. CSK15Z-1]
MQMSAKRATGLAFAATLLAAGAAGPTGAQQKTETAIFAGGCFWCVESDFDHVTGVLDTTSGYTGGSLKDPTYHQVSAGGTGHYESVRITFDPSKVSYAQLLDAYWHSVDPTDGSGQFCDRGASYKTAIFATSDAQLKEAQASEAAIEKDLGRKVATKVVPASTFYPAEDYHQDYYEKNPLKYRYYRYACGRNARVEEVWGDKAYEGIKDHSS